MDRRKQGMQRSVLVDGYCIPLGRALAGANRTIPRCWDRPWTGSLISVLPDEVTVHLDASYDSGKTRARLDDRGPHGEIAHKGEQAPIQATRRWYVERTNAWHNAFNRFQRCHERREVVIDAWFDLADAIITVRSLIRQAWTTHRWDTRPARRP